MWEVKATTEFGLCLKGLPREERVALAGALVGMCQSSGIPWDSYSPDVRTWKLCDEIPTLFQLEIASNPSVGIIYGLVGQRICIGGWGDLKSISDKHSLKAVQDRITYLGEQSWKK